MAINKGKPRKKKSDLKRAKEKAWSAFSNYIRTRDCIRFKNSLTDGICITCKREYPYKRLQAGHFIPGRNNAVLLDERIVYSQCAGCNLAPPRGLGGNYIEYFVFMEHEWGREKIDEFRQLKFKTVIYKPIDLLLLAEQFNDRKQQLIDEFNAKSA